MKEAGRCRKKLSGKVCCIYDMRVFVEPTICFQKSHAVVGAALARVVNLRSDLYHWNLAKLTDLCDRSTVTIQWPLMSCAQAGRLFTTDGNTQAIRFLLSVIYAQALSTEGHVVCISMNYKLLRGGLLRSYVEWTHHGKGRERNHSHSFVSSASLFLPSLFTFYDFLSLSFWLCSFLSFRRAAWLEGTFYQGFCKFPCVLDFLQAG